MTRYKYTRLNGDMTKTLYTEMGLSKLAEIVRQSRGGRSFREFQAVTGVSHATIRRIELEEVKSPEDVTLAAIAPHTPYSYEELKAIATERKQQAQVRSYHLAEDLLPYVNQLPDIEAARLAQMIVARLARMQ